MSFYNIYSHAITIPTNSTNFYLPGGGTNWGTTGNPYTWDPITFDTFYNAANEKDHNHIPVFLKCPWCGGTGRDTWMDAKDNFHNVLCAGCNGIGIQPVPWEELQ